MNGAQLRAPGLRRSPIHSIHATRRVEAPADWYGVPVTAEHPYLNHPNLASNTVVRSNGTVGDTTRGVSSANVWTLCRTLDQAVPGKHPARPQ